MVRAAACLGAIALALTTGEAFGEADGLDSPRVYQRIIKTASERSAKYGFVNFNQDRLQVAYRISETDFRRYNESYGYRAEDVKSLRRGRPEKLRDYLASRGFVLENGDTVRADIPSIVKRNSPQVKSLAQAFDRIAIQRGYRSMDIIGAVLSFAQTAIKYREPADVYKGKHTGGILAPLAAVVLGWGDCDTKTGMAASILSNWAQMRMIGIAVPGHYLMAVLQIPDKGDLFVEYQGLQYVLLEPAGPAWLPPGRVAEETVVQLNGSDGYKIYPFF